MVKKSCGQARVSSSSVNQELESLRAQARLMTDRHTKMSLLLDKRGRELRRLKRILKANNIDVGKRPRKNTKVADRIIPKI